MASPTFTLFEALQPHTESVSLVSGYKPIFQAAIQAGFDHLKRWRLLFPLMFDSQACTAHVFLSLSSFSLHILLSVLPFSDGGAF